MTGSPHRSRVVGALAAALALCSCGGGGDRHPRAGGTVAPPANAPALLDGAIALLDRGDEAGARKQIAAMLKRDPADVSARVLEESLDRDPVELLGAASFAYRVQPGETVIGLADRFLGNRLKFYQLARYNHLSPPAALAAGMTLRIPGELPRPAAEASPRAIEPIRPAPRPRPKPAPAAPAVHPAVADPAGAARARSAGLAALNQGHLAAAVALLRRAAALDPANPLIARDLARADRIAQTVRSRQ